MTYRSDFTPGLYYGPQRVSAIIHFLGLVKSYVEQVGRENVIVAWDSRVRYKKKELCSEYKADRVPSDFDREIWSQVDSILLDLDRPDPEIDRIWADESRARWQAYREGRADHIPYAEVMAKYRRP
jgi:5'-3' exonuclease